MISHNTSKEVIEITQSWGGALRSNFHVMNFLPDTKFYKILFCVSQIFCISKDTKTSDSAFPLFCFLTLTRKLYFESSTGFPKILRKHQLDHEKILNIVD